ncbi:MAG: HAD family hydrolase [Planktomarina sp.]
MTLQALIFDVDGTLAETEEAHRQAFNETFAKHGMDWEWSVEDYTRLLGTTGGKERMKRHREEIGASAPSDEEIAALHIEKTARYAEILASGGLALRPGVKELVAAGRAAGLKVAVATTTNRPNVDALTQCCWGKPAAEIFDVIAAGDEVSNKKPAPDVFELALERLGLPADVCIAFEDSVNGLKSSKAAKLPVIITPSAYTAHEDFTGADWVIATLNSDDLPSEFAAAVQK